MSASLNSLMYELETALKAEGLWSASAPSPMALASTAPFAIDTLSFDNWLQFLFLPRMRQLLSTGMPLPTTLKIAPAAELGLPGSAVRTLTVVKQIDEMFNEQ